MRFGALPSNGNGKVPKPGLLIMRKVFSREEKKMRHRILAAIFILILAGQARAEEEAKKYDLGKITVTPYRYEEVLTKTDSSVDIITQEDIQESNAGKIVDVMRPAVGVAVRDYYGNGATSVVDIAGFGEQAALYVLVLVDGRRVNDADLSGVDWNQIPLDQVERIEIIRSGAASVLYGDNASSGVINIITKNGSPAAVLVSPDEYESWKETRAVRSDKELIAEIKKGLLQLQKKKAKLYTLEEL